MLAGEDELRVTIFHTRQKLRDLSQRRKLGKMSDEDIIDVGTLNILLDAAIIQLKEVMDDKERGLLQPDIQS